MSSEPLKHVVIIGAGYGGAMLARALEADARAGKLRVTIIERRDSMHHKIGSIRATVNAEYSERCRIPLKNILKHAAIVEGEAVKVYEDEKFVLLNSGAHVDYDVLICATGTVNHSSGDLPVNVKGKDQIRQYFAETSAAICGAKRICIVGGGLTAVELAGEIREKYKDKSITLICSSANLLSSCVSRPNTKFYKALQAKLKQHNIDVVRGQKVLSPTPADFEPGHKFILGPIKVKTSSSECDGLEIDLVMWAATWTVNNGMYPDEWLNSSGELKVGEDFVIQACNYRNVFAFGDVSSISETKQAITLHKKIPVLLNNIRAVIKSIYTGTEPKLVEYKETEYVTVYLPIGSEDGVTQLGTWVYGGPKTSKWKGKDLFTDLFWKQLTGNAPPPYGVAASS